MCSSLTGKDQNSATYKGICKVITLCVLTFRSLESGQGARETFIQGDEGRQEEGKGLREQGTERNDG
jgi:hypothetical protein